MKHREHILTAAQVAALGGINAINHFRAALHSGLTVHIEIHGDGHEITRR